MFLPCDLLTMLADRGHIALRLQNLRMLRMLRMLRRVPEDALRGGVDAGGWGIMTERAHAWTRQKNSGGHHGPKI